MSDLEKVNGHRPAGLLPMPFAAALSSPEEAAKLPFDVGAALSAGGRAHAGNSGDAFTPPLLGKGGRWVGVGVGANGR